MGMRKADRAKLFAPFDALKGYREALRAKERIIVEKKELSEEMLAELDNSLAQIQVGTFISVVHYDKDNYIRTTGMVSKIILTARILQVVQTKIYFRDIIEITLDK